VNKIKADIEQMASTFQGFLNYKIPDVSKRTSFKITAALVDNEGETVSDNTFDFEVFPELSKNNITIYAMGTKAIKLAGEFDASVTRSLPKADVILVSDYSKYQKTSSLIDEAVRKGKKVIFTELDQGEYKIAGNCVNIDKCGMGNRHFVDRNTGHKLVEGFKADDFKWWYDQKAGFVTPFLSNVMKTNKFVPILYSGNGRWKAGPWQRYYAAAEKECGSGKIVICQLELNSRCRSNPIAAEFLNRLLNN
jgi:nucleoside-triphosphatase THEP1